MPVRSVTFFYRNHIYFFVCSQFKKTQEVSEYPLRAAKVYQNIEDALKDAEEAARKASEAADRAFDEVSIPLLSASYKKRKPLLLPFSHWTGVPQKWRVIEA